MDSGRTADERTANGYVSSLAGHGILDMKKRWTMKRIVDTLFVLVILGDIATVMNEEEFGYFLKSFEKKADLKSLSLISRRCQVVDTLCGLQSDTVLTVGQIKQLFDLEK